jgi:hypothetical protein
MYMVLGSKGVAIISAGYGLAERVLVELERVEVELERVEVLAERVLVELERVEVLAERVLVELERVEVELEEPQVPTALLLRHEPLLVVKGGVNLPAFLHKEA